MEWPRRFKEVKVPRFHDNGTSSISSNLKSDYSLLRGKEELRQSILYWCEFCVRRNKKLSFMIFYHCTVRFDIIEVPLFTNRCNFISVLENIKIYIKSYIKIAPTRFGLRPSSGSLHTSLAKVTFTKSVKVRRYGLCGCVAAILI
jgi:hypothetical protein